MKNETLALCLGLATSLASIGCVSDKAIHGGEPNAEELTVGKVQGEIKLGMSGAEVAEILGTPNIITTDEERREVWIYDKISTERMTADRSSYGTLILFGASGSESRKTTKQRTLTVIIKYDENKKVRDFAYNYTQF